MVTTDGEYERPFVLTSADCCKRSEWWKPICCILQISRSVLCADVAGVHSSHAGSATWSKAAHALRYLHPVQCPLHPPHIASTFVAMGTWLAIWRYWLSFLCFSARWYENDRKKMNPTNSQKKKHKYLAVHQLVLIIIDIRCIIFSKKIIHNAIIKNELK